MNAPTFWLCLTVAALAWYSTVTIYVSIKGVADIKGMLKRLTQNNSDDDRDS